MNNIKISDNINKTETGTSTLNGGSGMSVSKFAQESKILFARYRNYLKQAERNGLLFSSIDFNPWDYLISATHIKNEQDFFKY